MNTANCCLNVMEFALELFGGSGITGWYGHRNAYLFYDRGGDFHSQQAANLSPRGYLPNEKAALIAKESGIF